MAEVCSWCGTLIAEPDEKLDFVCRKCGEERRSRRQTPVEPRPWQAWMPEGAYPPLDKVDTRKI
jgi:DNA-directed RNA polymerase subunit RPC12/RpoP